MTKLRLREPRGLLKVTQPPSRSVTRTGLAGWQLGPPQSLPYLPSRVFARFAFPLFPTETASKPVPPETLIKGLSYCSQTMINWGLHLGRKKKKSTLFSRKISTDPFKRTPFKDLWKEKGSQVERHRYLRASSSVLLEDFTRASHDTATSAWRFDHTGTAGKRDRTQKCESHIAFFREIIHQTNWNVWSDVSKEFRIAAPVVRVIFGSPLILLTPRVARFSKQKYSHTQLNFG